ncbi:leucine-rich repeat transmembrane protein kinase protein [Artemisia annua]|uniref:Leucine-rich repeat transmembrane protein kinase protein n=1 Tax=Artemisia annua TaxID=35608 RepID=A0A2U1N9I4_ARTAN|nr:leucine-rich repeat transmembrane protein kinase protein [Artemisia annua]
MVHTQFDQSGFISIDCGIASGSEYTDNKTGINYVSDASFKDRVGPRKILPGYNSPNLDFQLTTLTFFPNNQKIFYTFRPGYGKCNKYLTRARFYLWELRFLSLSLSLPMDYEIIHVTSTGYIYVCLVDIGLGNPFISALELRLLDSSMINASPNTESVQQSRKLQDLEEMIFTKEDATQNEELKIVTAHPNNGIVRPVLEENIKFEFWELCLDVLKRYRFAGEDNEEAHEHISRVSEIIDLFQAPRVSRDDIMMMAFPFSLKGKALTWENQETIWGIKMEYDGVLKSHESAIRKLEAQVGNLAKTIKERGAGELPSTTETNPRDLAHAITTRIGLNYKEAYPTMTDNEKATPSNDLDKSTPVTDEIRTKPYVSPVPFPRRMRK